MLGFDVLAGFESNGVVLGVQLRPEADISLAPAKTGTKAKQEQLVGFGTRRAQFLARAGHERLMRDPGRRLEFHRALALKARRLKPVNVAFRPLAVARFESGNFDAEIRFAEDRFAEKTFAQRSQLLNERLTSSFRRGSFPAFLRRSIL